MKSSYSDCPQRILTTSSKFRKAFEYLSTQIERKLSHLSFFIDISSFVYAIAIAFYAIGIVVTILNVRIEFLMTQIHYSSSQFKAVVTWDPRVAHTEQSINPSKRESGLYYSPQSIIILMAKTISDKCISLMVLLLYSAI